MNKIYVVKLENNQAIILYQEEDIMQVIYPYYKVENSKEIDRILSLFRENGMVKTDGISKIWVENLDTKGPLEKLISDSINTI